MTQDKEKNNQRQAENTNGNKNHSIFTHIKRVFIKIYPFIRTFIWWINLVIILFLGYWDESTLLDIFIPNNRLSGKQTLSKSLLFKFIKIIIVLALIYYKEN